MGDAYLAARVLSLLLLLLGAQLLDRGAEAGKRRMSGHVGRARADVRLGLCGAALPLCEPQPSRAATARLQTCARGFVARLRLVHVRAAGRGVSGVLFVLCGYVGSGVIQVPREMSVGILATVIPVVV